jgi:hypothetical protein
MLVTLLTANGNEENDSSPPPVPGGDVIWYPNRSELNHHVHVYCMPRSAYNQTPAILHVSIDGKKSVDLAEIPPRRDAQ